MKYGRLLPISDLTQLHYWKIYGQVMKTRCMLLGNRISGLILGTLPSCFGFKNNDGCNQFKTDVRILVFYMFLDARRLLSDSWNQRRMNSCWSWGLKTSEIDTGVLGTWSCIVKKILEKSGNRKVKIGCRRTKVVWITKACMQLSFKISMVCARTFMRMNF